jgi:hypothetical protein
MRHAQIDLICPSAQKHSAARAEYVRVAALPMCWPLKSSSICLSIKGREGSAVRGLAGSAIEFLQRGTT